MKTLTGGTLAAHVQRPGNETYFPSVDEARSWRAGIALGVALGFASFIVNSFNAVLLFWLIAEVKDLSIIDGRLVRSIVNLVGFHVS